MPKPIICIGAAIIDDSFYCLDEPRPGTSNPAKHFRSAGGVARNIAHNLTQLGNNVELVSHFGNDEDGKWLAGQCSSVGIGLTHSRFSDAGTGRFTAIISPSGDLHIGAADTHLENEITVSFLKEKSLYLATASLILFDCNLSADCIAWLLDFCRSQAIPCVIDPVSIVKASRLENLNLEQVLLITPNHDELTALSENSERSVESLLKKGVQNIWIRNGKAGSELFSNEGVVKLPSPNVNVIDTTGAGDAALAGWVHAWLRNKSTKECLMYGHAMAEIILQTKGANSSQLNADLLGKTVLKMREFILPS